MEAKREGKYLAKFGDGQAFASEYGVYVVQTDQIVNPDNFSTGLSFCIPGQMHDYHDHPDHDEIILFTNGTGIQRIGKGPDAEIYEVHDNDMVYIPAGVPHSIENTCNQPIKMVIIKINKGKVQG